MRGDTVVVREVAGSVVVTIPKVWLDRVPLKTGDRVTFEVVDSTRVVLVKQP